MGQEHSFGWRDLLRAVNLRDFIGMVIGELEQIGDATRLAFGALPRLPIGPFLFFGGIAIVFLRLLLLAVVVGAFGSAILIISAVRILTRVRRRTAEGS